jgi:hypothetical protein
MSDSGYASLSPTLLARKGGAKPAMRPQLPAISEAAEAANLADEQLEDLGWNDMGDDAGDDEYEDYTEDADSVVVPFHPETPFDAEAAAVSPIVRRQQRRLEERVLADAVMTGPEDCDGRYDADDDEEPGSEEKAFASYEPEYPPLHKEEKSPADLTADAPTVLAKRPAKATKAAKVARPVPKAAAVAANVRRAAFTLRLDPDRHLKLRLAATMRGVSAQALVTDALDAMLAEFEDLAVIAAHLQRH